MTHGGDQGARVAIRLLQDAAERGEIDPWDVDVIAVIDGFLDQLRQTLDLPRQLAALGGSYEQGLAASSEAFLAASVLVALKAEHLEEQTLAVDQGEVEDGLEAEFDDGGGDGDGWPARLALPARPERLLSRRPVAPPPQRRPVSLGELIRQLEDIASRLEQEAGEAGQRQRRSRRYSDREAIAQVAALAHREKLPETTAALALFLVTWEPAEAGCDFEHLVEAWDTAAPPDLDRDRVGVFWALLFLCAQGRVTLEQDPQDLFGTLRLTRCHEGAAAPQLSMVAAGTPAETAAAA